MKFCWRWSHRVKLLVIVSVAAWSLTLLIGWATLCDCFMWCECSKMNIHGPPKPNGTSVCAANSVRRFFMARFFSFGRRLGFHQGKICRVQHITHWLQFSVLIQLNILRVPWERTFARIAVAAHKVSYLSQTGAHTHQPEITISSIKTNMKSGIFLTDASTHFDGVNALCIHVHRFQLNSISLSVEARPLSIATVDGGGDDTTMAIHQCVHSFVCTQRYKIVSWDSRSAATIFRLWKTERTRKRNSNKCTRCRLCDEWSSQMIKTKIK